MAQAVLTEYAQDLRRKPWLKAIDRFVGSDWFVGCVGLSTLCANLFGWELAVYTALMLAVCYIALFSKDLLPMMSIVICCYILPSVNNNPGLSAQSVFYPENGGIYLLCLFALALGCLIFRLVADRRIGGKGLMGRKRSLMGGIFLLGGAYLLAGIFSGRYFANGPFNLLFATVQFGAVGLLYWLFGGSVEWEKTRRDYFAFLGLMVGLTVSGELIGVYISQQVIENGLIHTGRIATGWGNANNMGCMIVMAIPCAVSLSKRKKTGWIFGALAILLLTAACFTCSRASILAAGLIYIFSLLVAFGDPARRKKLLFINGIAGILLGIFMVVNWSSLMELFAELVERGLNPRLRDVIYKEGLQTFLQHPIFGDTFYPDENSIYQFSTVAEFKTLLPARWHNTVIQLLASCGIVGLGCYSVHRLQTLKLFWQRRKTEGFYIGLSLLAILLMSLLDCHFFNIGPTLYYSMALAFTEHCFLEK